MVHLPSRKCAASGLLRGRPLLATKSLDSWMGSRRAIRARHYSPRTEKAFVRWIIRFILFHGKRHPGEMGPTEVERFLSHLATVGKVSASTQNQALSALLFLYNEVLQRELGLMTNLVWAKRSVRLPLVLSREEVAAILGRLDGTPWLMAALLYGSGLRLLECCRLGGRNSPRCINGRP